MNIIVCIKQVADTETRIRLTPDKKTIDTSDINWILNPYDEFAVEEALRIKEKGQGNDIITVITIGPERTTAALRSALAMGADEAIRIDVEDNLDSLATANLLVDVLKNFEFDLLLFGKQAVDDDNAQVGTLVAEKLDLPCVTVITELKLDQGKVTVKRELEVGAEFISTSLPAVLTAEKGLNEPRYPALRGIMMAKKKSVDLREGKADESKIVVTGYQYPPERKGGKIVGKGQEAVPELIRLLREEAKVF
ncbi:electron transfer flavoprotein subunit beta/FixA family protein [candidate division KSB1 bacterium]|nr:electron transfer flavoprotein subunit beta/FixA family protein [candidate division KSB1 bacterium]